MIDLEQLIMIKWNKSNKKYYSSKGYKYTKNGECFKVSVKDLPIGSHEQVKVYCDICMKERTLAFRDYNRNIEKNNKYICQPCSVSVRHENDLNDRRLKHFKLLLDKCLENGYELISDEKEILNNSSYIRYRCPVHGEQTMRVHNFITGKKCPKCSIDEKSKKFRLDDNEIISRILSCGGELLNPYDYINQSTKNLKFRCTNCGKVFLSTLQRFLQHGGQVCKECSKIESVGEIKIKKYLENNNLEFKQQYWFSDCRDTNPLPFDFYIPSKNVIIEFDGRQHFEDTNFFSYPLEKVQLHDKIKNAYCDRNNIGLIRIPYTQINHINEILDKKLFT